MQPTPTTHSSGSTAQDAVLSVSVASDTVSPWVILIRHPDFETEVVQAQGPEVGVIQVDLGASFDCEPDSLADARVWARDLLDAYDDAPSAAQDALRVVLSNLFDSWYGPDVPVLVDSDGTPVDREGSDE